MDGTGKREESALFKSIVAETVSITDAFQIVIVRRKAGHAPSFTGTVEMAPEPSGSPAGRRTKSAKERTALKVDGGGRKILVIDDDIAIRVLLEAVLTRMKFEVELAEDGQTGLERLKSSDAYYIVLLDLMMPHVNGYEFIDQVRKADSNVHIIVLTAAGQRGIDKILPGSVCNHILKPFDLEYFVEIVTACIEGHG